MSILKDITSAVISPQGAGAAIGGGLGILGSSITAAKSAEEAQRNREFQERMSSTAYQRAAEDLKSAGLNRILAFGSPASTPGGAVGQVPDFGQSLASGAQQGMAIGTTGAQIAETEMRTRKLFHEKNIARDKAYRELIETRFWKLFGPRLFDLAESGVNFIERFASDPEYRKQIYDELMSLGKEARDKATEIINKVQPEEAVNWHPAWPMVKWLWGGGAADWMEDSARRGIDIIGRDKAGGM